MDHEHIYPEDLAPGYALTPQNLEETHHRILDALAKDPEHAATLSSNPWASDVLLATAREHVGNRNDVLHDFDLVFNYWNWIYQFALYGQDYALAWDQLEALIYPRLDNEMLNTFCLTQGFAFVENGDAIIEKWQPILPAMLAQLEVSGVRVICNHATWMSQGILIVLLYQALQRYCRDNPSEKARVERLGLFDPMEMGTKLHTLLGPWITTLGHKLNPDISEVNAMAGVQAMSNVVKVFPDTPSGRLECCKRRWKGEVRKALRHLRHLEMSPGNLIFETPSGCQDTQAGGKLIPGHMAKAAVRLSRSRPNQLLLIGMDERALFNTDGQDGSFSGGTMQAGRIGFAVKSFIGQRPDDGHADWPFDCWSQMETTITELIENPDGSKIGQTA